MPKFGWYSPGVTKHVRRLGIPMHRYFTILGRLLAVITLERELTSLNALELEVLLAYGFEGYRHNEIARSLQVPEGTCRPALSRARKRLRARLAWRYRVGPVDRTPCKVVAAGSIWN